MSWFPKLMKFIWLIVSCIAMFVGLVDNDLVMVGCATWLMLVVISMQLDSDD